MQQKALITGITGQVGSYLAELLLRRGYQVHGIIRRSSSFNTSRLDSIYQDPHSASQNLFLHYGDLADSSSLSYLIRKIEPQLLFNMGAQSHVRVSFDIPEYTGDVVALGVTRILEAVRESKIPCRVYQASSSEIFGDSPPPQNENTPHRPRSPYAAAKLYGYHMIQNYRQAYNMFACNGIVFNTESPRRTETFVTRKITRAVARIKNKTQDKLFLGNLESKRDWSYAPDAAEAIYRIITHDQPDDFVIATGEMHSIREFLDEAFGIVDLDWRKHVEIDPRYFRPTEVDALCGDYSKAKKVLGWEPKVKFKELVKIMVEYDLSRETT